MSIGLREFTLFALLLGIVAAAGWFVFLPDHRELAELDRENHAKLARLAQLDRVGQTSESLTKELADLQRALEFFESKLPNDQQISAVLGEITQICEKHQLKARTIKTLKQEQFSDYIMSPIELELDGKFESFYRFLLDLERMPRITRISHMEVFKDKHNEGQVTTKMIMSIYFEAGPRSEVPTQTGRGRV